MARVAERVRARSQPEAPPRLAPAETGPGFDWVPLAFALLTVAALVLRVYDLGSRAMHHDESLHAVYSWYLYVGRGYTHDPMMHGPLLFEASALMYFLFGDSEFTARLTMALMGTVTVVMPWFLRHELGRVGAVAAAAMLAFQPSFVYFSRFARHDAMVVFEAMVLVVGLFGWFRTRRPVYFYTGAVGLGLLFATKEDSLIYGTVFATFLAVAVAVGTRRGTGELLDVLAAIGWRRWATAAAVFFGMSAVLYTTFFTNLEGVCTALLSPPVGSCAAKQGALQYWLSQQGVARGSQPWFYYFLIIPLYEILPLTLAVASGFVARRPRSLLFWFCAWWSVLSLVIYTWAGEKMPWLIVHPVLPLILLGAMSVDRVAAGLRLPWGLKPRQWSIAGLVLLSMAAFIAWASVGGTAGTALESQTATLRRVALSIVVIGLAVGAYWVGRRVGGRERIGSAAAALLILLTLYTVHTGWQLNFKNGDTPVDMLVYVQSAPDVVFVTRELERIGNTLGPRRDVPILLDGGYSETVAGQNVAHEAISWPFEWYLRDFKGKQYYSKNLPVDFSTGKYAAVLAMGPNLDPIRDQLSGYTGNKFRLNWWYPEDYKQLSPATSNSLEALAKTFFDSEGRAKFFGTIWSSLGDPETRVKLIKYVLYRDLVNPPLGSRDFYFYVRNDLMGTGVSGSGMPAVTIPAAPAIRSEDAGVRSVALLGRPAGQQVLRDPKGAAVGPDGLIYVVDGTAAAVTVFNRDGSVARTWGRPGTGDGEFTEPWGIAVATDGSVFVADTWAHRIQKFDSQGRFLTKWGVFGDVGGQASGTPGAFFGPRDIAFTPNGELLVTDTGNKRILVFDRNGRFLRAHGGDGRLPGQFREPVGLAVDASGRVYVADAWNQRVQVLSPQFEPIAQYSVTAWTSQAASHKPYLTVAPNGDIYATVPEKAAVVRVRDGVVSTLTFREGPRLSLPIGIHLGPDSTLYVSDAQQGLVIAYGLPSSEPAEPFRPEDQPAS